MWSKEFQLRNWKGQIFIWKQLYAYVMEVE